MEAHGCRETEPQMGKVRVNPASGVGGKRLQTLQGGLALARINFRLTGR
jgi:hypothetical protein